MKWIAPIALTLALSPVLAAAQTPPPPEGGQTGQRFAAMRQMHEQMAQMHAQARAQMLAALTPQHRAQIASVVGNLAVAANPNAEAAAAQIDALLTPTEKQSVLAIHASARTAMQNAMQAEHARFEASLTPEERTKMQERAAQMQQRAPRVVDAGTVLLHSLGHSGPEGMHGGPDMMPPAPR